MSSPDPSAPNPPAENSQLAELWVNGDARRMAELLGGRRATVAGLLEALGLAGTRVAVARNGDVVPRSRFDAEPVAADDRIEILEAVGGG